MRRSRLSLALAELLMLFAATPAFAEDPAQAPVPAPAVVAPATVAPVPATVPVPASATATVGAIVQDASDKAGLAEAAAKAQADASESQAVVAAAIGALGTGTVNGTVLSVDAAGKLTQTPPPPDHTSTIVEVAIGADGKPVVTTPAAPAAPVKAAVTASPQTPLRGKPPEPARGETPRVEPAKVAPAVAAVHPAVATPIAPVATPAGPVVAPTPEPADTAADLLPFAPVLITPLTAIPADAEKVGTFNGHDLYYRKPSAVKPRAPIVYPRVHAKVAEPVAAH